MTEPNGLHRVPSTPLLADAVVESDFTLAQRNLYDAMSEISEDCYCAGWMGGCEYAIWNAIVTGDRRYGMGKMNAATLDLCRRLSAETGGWIVWVDDDFAPGCKVAEWGPRFIPMKTWEQMFKANTPLSGTSPLEGKVGKEKV